MQPRRLGAAPWLALLALLCLWQPALAGDTGAVPPELPVPGKVTLVDLGAATCIPCKMMAPILEELKREYQGRAEVHFVDVRLNKAAIERFKVKGIPSQVFFDRQGREVYRHLGFMDKPAIVMVLQKLLADQASR
ncbi:MAG: thioredoxin family protein [Pseudomonadota bacterium]